MKIINLGSLNMDKTYCVSHIVKPGETIAAGKNYVSCGGKGLNQSIALARAGADVYHAGLVGTDGDSLIGALESAGVKTGFIQTVAGDSGHAIIQLDDNGENSIIVCSGANSKVDAAYIDEVLEGFGPGDLLLLQNEIAGVDYAIMAARRKGMTIALNLSPIGEACFAYHLADVDLFVLNEVEAAALAGVSGESAQDDQALIDALQRKYPKARFVITMGKKGSCYVDGDRICCQGSYRVKAVDTTGAGDTFCGYFLALTATGRSVEEALVYASAAGAIAVGRRGASPSIPNRGEVESFIHMRRDE